ncbi:hypothetical protein [Halopseudomonas sp.]|uniref:hypothetical protein n=1 Tax=Halopseudomonas sp. TaxID=2901191 RepID=UPI00300350AB
MAELPLDEAVARFQGNEERINKFVNAPGGEESFQTSQGETVPVLPKMIEVVSGKLSQAEEAVVASQAAAITALASGRTYTTPEGGVDSENGVPSGAMFLMRTASPQIYEVWLNEGGVAVDQSVTLNIASGKEVKEVFDYVNRFMEIDPYDRVFIDENENVIELISPEDKRQSLLPYTAESIDNGLSYALIAGVSEVFIDENGNIVVVRYDGGPPLDFTTKESDSAEAEELFDGVRDAIWNDWIYPRHLGFRGNSYMAPVAPGDSDGTPGDQWAAEKIKGAPTQQRVFSVTNGYLIEPLYSDDHNAGAVIADPRSNADYPLMVFCTGHNGADSVMQFWRSATYSMSDLERVSGVMPSRTGLSYSMVYRNPNNWDEIILWTRTGGSGNATWWLWRTLDNGATWTERAVFASEQLYFLGKPTLDDSGVHLFCHQRPDRPDQRIGYLKFNWNGSIATPDGTYVADVYDAGFAAVDPWADDGLYIVHTPAVGYDTRLADGLETSAGIEFLWSEFTLGAPASTGQYKHLVLDGETVTLSPDIGETGSPIEVTGANYYIGGGAICGAGLVAVASNTSEGGVLTRAKLSGGAWLKEALLESKQKVARPVAMAYVTATEQTVRPRVAVLEGTYTQYREWKTNIKILEV